MFIDIAEADLQIWFEDKSRKQTIVDYIVNHDELNTLPKWERQGIQESERVRLWGLDNAKKVFDRLSYAKHISGNRSIADKGHTQLRPDLILISEDANYILVELKTRKETERQAVQELLAYSAAMKMQLPFTNEFMFVVVAVHWDTLLKFSVQSLIMDGKNVLPLVLESNQSGGYQLRILQSLFDVKLKVSYDPFYAMVPYTLATTVYFDGGNDLNARKARRLITNYFRRMSFEIAADCRKVRQSGFVLLWRNPLGFSSEIISMTVVTVNQYWEYNEHKPSFLHRHDGLPVNGVKRVQQNTAKLLRDEVYSRPRVKDAMLEELEDVFLSAEAWQAEASLYAQSSFSFDLIERHIDHDVETLIKQTGAIQLFECESEVNLKTLLSNMQDIKSVQIDILSTFGDVSDFLYNKRLYRIFHNINFATFNKLMEDFRRSRLDI
ncbi:TPA: hypothetical protein JHJ49_003775 [Citrobacter koseri]|nr:hypothetical protein [Citrobacter koseri]